MAKLLEVGVKVQVPSGSTGSPVFVEYSRAYYANAIAAGGHVEGQVGAVSGGLASLLNKAGNGPLMVYGGEEGDPVPPLVTLRIKPRGTGVKGVAWEIAGHPRDTGGGVWDGSAINAATAQLVQPETALRVKQIVDSYDAVTLDLTAERQRVDQALADTAQAGALAVSAAGITPVSDLAGIGAGAGLYRTMDNGQVWERPQGGGAPVRRPELEAASAATTAVTAIALGAADVQKAMLRALDVGAGEIPAGADWTLTQRLVIDCQGRRFNFVNKGRLHFDVKDANGGAIIQIINPAPGSNIDLGYWDHVGIPMPSYLIMRGEEHLAQTDAGKASAPPIPAEYGPAFARNDTDPSGTPRLHWRTHSDHGAEIVNAVGCTITVNLGAARAMGVVFNGGHDNHVYGFISNTLADGTHMHNGAYNIHWHGVHIKNAGDDAFPVVPKMDPDHPEAAPVHSIHYWGCMAEGGYGRGFVQAGAHHIYWHACSARDTFKEGFLVLNDFAYHSGVPEDNFAEDCTAIGSGLRDTSQQGDARPAGFRVGYAQGKGETRVKWTRCTAVGNSGSGFWAGGVKVDLVDCASNGNGNEDMFYSTDLTIRGGQYQQSVINTAYYRILDLPQWRKPGSNAPYALKIVQDNPGRIEADFGSEWGMYPLATTGALTQVDLRGSIGVGNRMLPDQDYYGTTPALPGSDAAYITNNTPFDVMVLIQGGDVLGINLKSPDGIEVGIGPQRMVTLPRGWSINPFWNAAPQKWFWAAT